MCSGSDFCFNGRDVRGVVAAVMGIGKAFKVCEIEGCMCRNVVPVMAMGVAELKRELKAEGGLTELPEIHQFLDGFYMSRIGIRILIGQHIALHEPQQKDHIGMVSRYTAHL